MKFTKRLLSSFLVGILICSQFFCSPILYAEAESVQNSLLNGSFENGLTGWNTSGSSPNTSTEAGKVTDGNSSLMINKGLTKVWQFVKVEKNSKYTLSFDYLSTSATEGWGWVSFSAAAAVSSTPVDTNTISEPMRKQTTWTEITGEVETGDNEYVCIYIVTSGTLGASTPARYFDNFKLEKEIKKGVIVNGSFEDKYSGWTTHWTSPSKDYSSDGAYSAEFDCANAYFFQYVPVDRNKQYTLSYDYIDLNGAGYTWVSLDFCNADNQKYLSGTFIDDFTPSETRSQHSTSWTTYTSPVLESGENDYLCIAVRSTVSAWNGTKKYFDNFKLNEYIESSQDSSALLVNPSFEEGLNGWSHLGSSPTIVTDNVTHGNNALMTNKGLTKVWQYVRVEKNSKYCLSFDYLSTSATEGWGWVSFSPASKISSTPVDTNTISEPMREQTVWTNIKGVVDSGENDYLCVYIVISGTLGAAQPNRYFDNFKIVKLNDDDSLIINGDFELDSFYWEGDSDFFETPQNVGLDSSIGLKINSGHHKLFYQKLTLDFETNYKLEFDYKGTLSESAILWGIGDELSLSFHKVTTSQKVASSSDWKHYTAVFRSDDANPDPKITKIDKYFMLQSSIGTDVVIDNVRLTPTNEAVTVTSNRTRAYILGPVYENLAEMFLGGPKSGSILLDNYDIKSASDSKVNNATYFYATDNDKDGNSCAEIVSGGPDVSHFKDSSIKIVANSDEEIVSIPLKLKANSTYCFGFMGKSDYYYAKDGEFTRFTYGVADGETGNFLTVKNITDGNTWKQYQDYFQFLGINDGKWHWNCFKIETNDQTDFYFQFRATHATVFLDRIAVWNPADSTSVETNSPLTKLKNNVSIVDENPDKLGIKDGGMNYVQNFDFEYAIDSYWSDDSKFVNHMYGTSLNIVDTNSAQGKAFQYKPDTLYPHNIYYFKWIDVEPNTEYTFSAKYSVTKAGNGGFGIVSGYNAANIEATRDSKGNVISENQIYPTIVKEYSFASECSWNTVGFTFNTGDRNRVGIFVKDSGGEAFMDEFRLFKTSDAEILGLNQIVNSSFEEKGSWNQYWCSIVDTNSSDGNKSLELDCAKAYAFQYVPVERNTDYVISYDYINNGVASSGANSWVSFDFCSKDNQKFINNTYIDTYTPQDGYGAYATEWTTKSYTLNSGENDYLCITIRSSITSWAKGAKKYYDNFTLKKASKVSEEELAVIVNNSFENNYTGWKAYWNSPSNSYSSDGNKSAEFDCAKAYLYQYVPVKKNTKYTVSYDYIDLNGAGYTWVAFDFSKTIGETFIDSYVPAETRTQNATSWTNYTSPVLNSGDNDYLCISIRSTTGKWEGTKKYFDNFKLEEYVPKKNVIVNNGFEGVGFWNQHWCSIVNSVLNEGNRALELDCANAYAFQFIPVDKNSKYTVSYDYISSVSSGNFTRVAYDFCKADDIKLIANKYIDYNSPDNAKGNYATEWTTVKNTLYSGNNDYLCISIRTTDYWPSGAKKYFDNFILEKNSAEASKGTLTGTYKFAFNVPISFDYYPQDAKEVGAKIWRADKNEQTATVLTLDPQETVFSISNISIYGIKNVFSVKPYIIDAEGNTYYAEVFNVSYLDWLLMHKDNTEPSKAAAVKKINEILDTYYVLTGNPAYENQTYPVLENAPTGEWKAKNPYSESGNSEYGLASTKPIQGSFPKGILRINLDYGSAKPQGAALVYKYGNSFNSQDLSNAAANISFGTNAMTSIDITGIAFANYAKQYTIIPYIASQDGNIYGNVIKISYSDFLAYALNNADSTNRNKAYAVCKLYKSIYGSSLCELK